MPPDVFYKVITQPSIKDILREVKLIQAVTLEDWKAPLMAFINGFYHPESKVEISRMQQRGYQIIQGDMYKSGVSSPLLKCLGEAQGKELLSEIHSGIYGSHIGVCVLAGKAIRHGFYWTTMVENAKEIVKICEAC